MLPLHRRLALITLLLLLGTLFVAPAATRAAEQVIVVTTTKDLFGPNPTDGCGTAAAPYTSECSLRQAINDANRSINDVLITFNIDTVVRSNPSEAEPGYREQDLAGFLVATWTITPSSSLPALNNTSGKTITIDGSSQARNYIGGDNFFGPEIVIDGSLAADRAGLVLVSNNITINDLAIGRFQGDPSISGEADLKGVGIEIQGNQARLLRNYVGVDALGSSAAPNDAAGIWVNGGQQTTIGGAETEEGNLISGNQGDGILITGSTAISTTVSGNAIGLNLTGRSALANGANGIQVRGAQGFQQLGTPSNASDRTRRNIIAGNGANGILLRDSQGAQVLGNVIGLARNGSTVLGNVGAGVAIVAETATSSNHSIGGTTSFARNIIAGNSGPGVKISGANASNNLVRNNTIGLTLNNSIPSVRQPIGVLIEQNASNNTIGGAIGSNQYNLIAAASGDGVAIQGNLAIPGQAVGNSVSGNYIGVDPLGNNVANGGAGIRLSYTSGTRTDPVLKNTQLGGASNNSQNILANNPDGAIVLDGAQIQGTTIGKTIARQHPVAIVINAAQQTLIDGADSTTPIQLEQNPIGIQLSQTISTTIRLSTISNSQTGLLATQALSLTIEQSRFRDNQQAAVISETTSLTTNQSQFEQNLSGLTVVDTNKVLINQSSFSDNQQTGVLLQRIQQAQIISATISNNQQPGMVLDTVRDSQLISSTLNANQGGLSIQRSNGIQLRGVNITNDQQSGLVVDQSGYVRFEQGTLVANQGVGAVIGGLSQFVSIRNSTIISNTAGGILVSDTNVPTTTTIITGTQPVTILDNRISANGVGGILLDSQGNGIASPNHDIDPPLELRLNQSGLVSGRVISTNNDPNSCLPATACRIQLFAANPQLKDGQGRDKLGETFAAADGRFSLNIGQIPAQLVLTATDGSGATSSFAIFNPVVGPLLLQPTGPLNAGQLAQSGRPGDQLSYRAAVLNQGNVDFNDLELSFQPGIGWQTGLAPASPLSVAAGSSQPVTLTLQLPTGSDPKVIAGLVDRTQIKLQSEQLPNQQAMITATTTVLGKFLLSATPISLAGSGLPGASNLYQYQLTNNGNITTTLNLSAASTVGGLPAPIWVATPTSPTVTLRPGETLTTTMRVSVPNGAQAGTSSVARLQVTSPDPSQKATLVATTTVNLKTAASIFVAESGDASAGATISFFHTVVNLSNGPATFIISGTSSLGSNLRFRSDTPGVILDNQNRFTLSNTAGANIFNVIVEVTVPASAIRGQTDSVLISILNADGSPVPGATVRDTITVAKSIDRKVYLALMNR